MKDVFVGFLGKTLNLPADSVAEKLFKKSDDGTLTDELSENALQNLLDLDAERVKGLKVNTKELFDNGYKKGQKEALTDLEKQLRSNFGVDDISLQGVDLVKTIVSKTAKSSLDDDKVKSHKLFLQLEKQLRESELAMTQKTKEVEDKWKGELERYKISGVVRAEAEKFFDSLEPVLPVNPVAARQQKEDFLGMLTNTLDWQQDGESFIPIREGKRLEDKHGHPLRLDELVKEMASQRFDFKKQAEKGNAGNANNQGNHQNGISFPKTEGEYTAMMMNPTLPDKERVALAKAWSERSK